MTRSVNVSTIRRKINDAVLNKKTVILTNRECLIVEFLLDLYAINNETLTSVGYKPSQVDTLKNNRRLKFENERLEKKVVGALFDNRMLNKRIKSAEDELLERKIKDKGF